MEDIKQLFKRAIIVTVICFLFGLIFQNKYLLFGVSGGCAISVIALYMLSLDSKAIAYSKDVKIAKRMAYMGYARRYILHLVFFVALIYIFDDFKVFLGGFVGTLNVKFNILVATFLKKIMTYLK